jgi:hypothetical protein
MSITAIPPGHKVDILLKNILIVTSIINILFGAHGNLLEYPSSGMLKAKDWNVTVGASKL